MSDYHRTAPERPEPGGLFGDWLRYWRLTADMSRRELARRIFMDHKTIQKWELHTSVPRIDVFVALAEALDRDPASLIAEWCNVHPPAVGATAAGGIHFRHPLPAS